MIITFLGTGTSTGIPMVGCHCAVCHSSDPRDKRLRSSVMVTHQDKQLLIDCGPDFRQQMLREGFDHIDAVLLTHSHRDHVAGLDDMKTVHFKDSSNSQIYCSKLVEDELRQIFFYVFSNTGYPGVPRWDIYPSDGGAFTIGDIGVIPIDCFHGSLPVQGFRIEDFAYLTDINKIPESAFSQLENLSVLVLDALRLRPHHSHFNLEEALAMAKRIGAKSTYLTHICHQMPQHEEVSKKLPDSVFMAYDGLKIFV